MAQPCGVLAANAGALLGAIADALEKTAHDLACDVEHGEFLAAAAGAAAPGIAHAHSELKLRAELLGIAHAYFKEMAEHPETPVIFDRLVYGVPGVTKP